MNIGVIFTCFNRKKTTLRCINSLITGNPDINLHFIVVDDASTDGTSEELKKISSVSLIEGRGNLYYTGGMRRGIDYVKRNTKEKYDYILFINDDVLFSNRAIENLIKECPNNQTIIVGCVSDQNGNLSYGGIVQKKMGPCYSKIYKQGENVECDTMNANCVLIPYKLFMQLDNMDEVYRHSLGDYDYGLQAKKTGARLITSSFYVGLCDDNSIKDTWRDVNLPRITRIKKKESVKGSPFGEWFHFLYKNYGLLVAFRYSITPYIRILIGK